MCALLKKLVTQNIIKKKSRNNSEFFYFKTKRVYPNLERQSSGSRLSGSLWFLKRWNLHECSVSCKQEVRPPSWATRKHRAARFPAQKVTLITFSNTPRNSCKWLYMISSGGSNTTCKYEVARLLESLDCIAGDFGKTWLEHAEFNVQIQGPDRLSWPTPGSTECRVTVQKAHVIHISFLHLFQIISHLTFSTPNLIVYFIQKNMCNLSDLSHSWRTFVNKTSHNKKIMIFCILYSE